MRKRTGILDKLAAVRERARGDSIGVAGDWRSLVTLADLALRRYEDDGDADRYLDVLRSISHVVGTRGAEDFRGRHRDLVAKLAPDSEVARAFMEPRHLEIDAEAVASRIAR